MEQDFLLLDHMIIMNDNLYLTLFSFSLSLFLPLTIFIYLYMPYVTCLASTESLSLFVYINSKELNTLTLLVLGGRAEWNALQGRGAVPTKANRPPPSQGYRYIKN